MRDHVPDCHLVKLGTMGEYGQPNIDIEEGYIEIEHKGRKRHPALPEAARLALPLLQGPRLDQHPLRLPHLGPARHRPQPGRRLRDRDRGDRRRRAADHPLRLRRDLRHRAQPLLRAGGDRPPAHRLRRRRPDPRLPQHPRHPACVELAVANPAERGEFRVFNQFTEQFSVLRAGRAGQARRRAPRLLGRDPALDNPRVEKEEHYYNAIHTKLLDLGLRADPARRGAGRVDDPRDRAPQGPRDRELDRPPAPAGTRPKSPAGQA